MKKKKNIVISLVSIILVIALVGLSVLCFNYHNKVADTQETTAITTETTIETGTTLTETVVSSTDSVEGSTTETILTGETLATSNESAATSETEISTTISSIESAVVASTTESDTTLDITTTVNFPKPVANSSAAKVVNTTTHSAPAPTPAATTTSAKTGKDGLTLVKKFTGTYYAYGGPRKGGSGRQLINCATGGQGVKGSIACRYLYNKYGYKKNGRTKVYIEVQGYSKMNGWYYLDDCCGSNNVIDFFYINGKSCPFSR